MGTTFCSTVCFISAKDQLDILVWTYFRVSYSVPLVCVSLPSSEPHCLDWVSVNIRSTHSSHLILLFTIVLTFLGNPPFHINLRANHSTSTNILLGFWYNYLKPIIRGKLTSLLCFSNLWTWYVSSFLIYVLVIVDVQLCFFFDIFHQHFIIFITHILYMFC